MLSSLIIEERISRLKPLLSLYIATQRPLDPTHSRDYKLPREHYDQQFK